MFLLPLLPRSEEEVCPHTCRIARPKAADRRFGLAGRSTGPIRKLRMMTMMSWMTGVGYGLIYWGVDTFLKNTTVFSTAGAAGRRKVGAKAAQSGGMCRLTRSR